MTRIHGFPPLAEADARCLVLGSVPGKASLRAGQYYAHPRNAFWPIIGALFGIPLGLAYAERCRQLTAAGIAVWDVLQSCSRSSSLDTDIDQTSIVSNDFGAFFADHPTITLIVFNGAMAERSFARHVLPTLPPAIAGIPWTRLPSTSPANASFSVAAKLERWRVIAG